MITVISGTNRKGAKTHFFAKKYAKIIQTLTDEKVQYISLEDIPVDVLHVDMYGTEGQCEGLTTLQDACLIPAHKWVLFSPEYNGSYPGIVKLFLDACSIRDYKGTFSGKKIGLVGIASGRAGNLRGMDHLTSVFNHVGASIFPNKLPISGIDDILTDDGTIADSTIEVMRAHAENFVAF